MLSVAWGWVAIVATAATAQVPGAIKPEEVKYQSQAFEQWWGTALEWRFDELPEKGSVPDYRVPYSGHDYPDKEGGVVRPLRKYDLAFHGGRPLALGFEQKDVTAQKEPTVVRRGLFGLRRRVEMQTPSWHGHCNGWTAAAIRHSEPQHSVTRNGVVFTPADIKGLLADAYMYNDSEFLGGVDPAINPGTLHVVIANWIGRGEHPVGMETTLGEVAFNYPAYAYAASSARRGRDRMEVKMNVAYAKSTPMEYDKSPRVKATMYFHYELMLDEEGRVVGGRYFGDSARIDMLWSPLHLAQGGEPGNERGNPHVDVKEVLAIWRESVPEELRSKWYNIDPDEEDRVEDAEQPSGDDSPASAVAPPED